MEQMEVKKIWDQLFEEIKNPFGVAGLMGNLFAESSLDPKCLTGGGLKTKEQKDEYILKLKTKNISLEEFAHDGVAFGLAQWCYWSRKSALYSFVEEENAIKDICTSELQIKYLLKEIQTYKTVWNTLLNATSVKEASDIVMLRYEKPANTSEKAMEKRQMFSQIYYDQFALIDIPSNPDPIVMTTVSDVNIRCGNGKNYAVVAHVGPRGTEFPWVATSDNNWHAIVHNNRVCWISGDFSEVKV